MQITNLYNKEGSLEDARPKSFGSEFFRTVDLGQQYDTVSHVGGIVFHSIQQSTLVYHIRRDTLHYFTKSSIILDIHFLVHYIRRDAPPYFTMSAHPG